MLQKRQAGKSRVVGKRWFVCDSGLTVECKSENGEGASVLAHLAPSE